MTACFKITGLALVSCLFLVTGGTTATHAATSSTLDILPNDVMGVPAERVEVGKIKPLTVQKRESVSPPPSGNPLWSIPLSVLTATQERPIFSASRRPPPRAIAGPRIEPVTIAAPKPAEPERLSLTLIGAVVGDSDAIAVFLDRTTQGVVRLRVGDAHAGWTLSSIQRREAAFKKADQTEVLALQRSDVSPALAASPRFPVQPAQAVGAAGMSFAPFIPRSTPKNGESDGL